jgi:ribosomal protein S26
MSKKKKDDGRIKTNPIAKALRIVGKSRVVPSRKAIYRRKLKHVKGDSL